MFSFSANLSPVPRPRSAHGAPPHQPGQAGDEACEAEEEEQGTDDEETEMPEAFLL